MLYPSLGVLEMKEECYCSDRLLVVYDAGTKQKYAWGLIWHVGCCGIGSVTFQAGRKVV